jgi:AmpE protein
MIFLSLVIVLAILYWVGYVSAIHYDGWFKLLVSRLQKIPGVASVPALTLVLSLLIPLAVLLVLFAVIYQISGTRHGLIFLYVPVLLYSLGRGNFIADVKSYIELVNKGDNVAASLWLESMRGKKAEGKDTEADIEVDDWRSLHTRALKAIAYRGFERTFAVIFWFLIIGPFGALLYRLSVLYREFAEEGSAHAQVSAKWLWLLELPAVRLMGLTWAFVGNFETCPLQKTLLDIESSSARVLNECLRGALGASTECATATMETMDAKQKAEYQEEMEEETQDIIEDLTGDVITTHNEPAYSFALIKSSMPLYTRSLLFWVCAIAFATLFI